MNSNPVSSPRCQRRVARQIPPVRNSMATVSGNGMNASVLTRIPAGDMFSTRQSTADAPNNTLAARSTGSRVASRLFSIANTIMLQMLESVTIIVAVQ